MASSKVGTTTAAMRLQINDTQNFEIVHFYQPDLQIYSAARRVTVFRSGEKITVDVPESPLKQLLGCHRLSRRLLRLDKCNVFPVSDGLVIARGGFVYKYNYACGKLTPTLQLQQCRNMLHLSICQTPGGALYFGEYGMNPDRNPVPIYRSCDQGNTWEVIHRFEAGKIRHVHGCYYDPVQDSIWVCTGDFQNECWVIQTDHDFQQMDFLGTGQQQFRTCGLFFQEDSVHWIMDSELEACHHIVLDRQTQRVAVKNQFQGPVWYIKRLKSDLFLAATVQERGPGVLDQHVHLMASADLQSWTEVAKFDHDGLPKRYFKNGVIGFAEGDQTPDDFAIFFEAVASYDGKVALCSIG